MFREVDRHQAGAPDRPDTRLDLALTLFVMGRGPEALSETQAALRRLERSDSGRRRGVLEVALDDLREQLVKDESLGSDPDLGRARVAMEAALADLPSR